MSVAKTASVNQGVSHTVKKLFYNEGELLVR